MHTWEPGQEPHVTEAFFPFKGNSEVFWAFLKISQFYMFNHISNICIGSSSGRTITQRAQLRTHFILGIVKWTVTGHLLLLENLWLIWKLGIWVLGKNRLNFPFIIIWSFYTSNIGEMLEKYHFIGTSLSLMLFCRIYSQQLVQLSFSGERWEF